MKDQETEAHNLTELTARLKEATDNFAKAAEGLSGARTEHVNAINALNRAQKEFDLCIERIKEQAPNESDWHRRIRVSHVTEA